TEGLHNRSPINQGPINPPRGRLPGQNTESHSTPTEKRRGQNPGIPDRARGRAANRRMQRQSPAASRSDHDPAGLASRVPSSRLPNPREKSPLKFSPHALGNSNADTQPPHKRQTRRGPHLPLPAANQAPSSPDCAFARPPPAIPPIQTIAAAAARLSNPLANAASSAATKRESISS